MTKPTLADFIDRPFTAVRGGYKPDFMSVGAMAASIASWQAIKNVAENFTDCIDCYVYELPKNLGIAFFWLLLLVSVPLLFPVWWLFAYWMWNYKDKSNG